MNTHQLTGRAKVAAAFNKQLGINAAPAVKPGGPEDRAGAPCLMPDMSNRLRCNQFFGRERVAAAIAAELAKSGGLVR